MVQQAKSVHNTGDKRGRLVPPYRGKSCMSHAALTD